MPAANTPCRQHCFAPYLQQDFLLADDVRRDQKQAAQPIRLGRCQLFCNGFRNVGHRHGLLRETVLWGGVRGVQEDGIGAAERLKPGGALRGYNGQESSVGLTQRRLLAVQV